MRVYSRSLIILMVAITAFGIQGCSLFGKGKKKDDETVIVEPDYTPSGPDVVSPPPDNPAEGPRPGELMPMPDMRAVYFDYDRAQIRPDQLERLDYNLRYLQDNPEVNVMIEGHCDERGTIEYNFNLGMRRANSVKDYFVQNGIPTDRIAVQSKGEEEPAVIGQSEAAWSKNRRVEFLRMF